MLTDRQWANALRLLPAPPPAWFTAELRPVSWWRWQQLWYEAVRRAVGVPISRAMVLAALPRLGRYLQDTPRRKTRQPLAGARHWRPQLVAGALVAQLSQPAHPEQELAVS